MNDDNLFEFVEVEERPRSPHLIPWLVTGLIAVVALLLAVVVLNISRSAQTADPEPVPPVQVEPDEVDPQPEPEQPTPTPEPEPEPEPEQPVSNNPDDAIDTSSVVVGETYTLDVEWGWDITTEVSNKLVSWSYTIPDPNHLQLESDLIKSLPSSCNEQKSSWGLERDDDGKISAWSPQDMCEEAESLYTELLGLVRHMSDTVKPLD